MNSRLRTLVTAAIALLVALPSYSHPNTRFRPQKTVFLYQDKIVEIADPVQGKEKEALGLDMIEDNGITAEETYPASGNIENISANARIDLYFPKKPNGQMVVVCPGGGYFFASAYNEGVYVAEWMVEQGTAVAVVKYRMPNGHWELPLADVHNTFRYCREHAAEWGIEQIGVMGFSAGGHLAGSATTLYTDAVTRPDFSILVYPVLDFENTVTHKGTRRWLIGTNDRWTSTAGKTADEWIADQKKLEELVERYSLQKHVTPDTPPTFLIHCTDDPVVPVRNSICFYEQLVKNKVSAEMHLLPVGKHGWGFSSERYVEKDRIGYAREEFQTSLARWMKSLRTY